MGKKDTITKEYMRNPVVFADAFNKYLYHGRQMIKPESLRELDTTEITVPYGSDDAGVPEQKYRDVLKMMMTDGDIAYCLLGIENQSDIHYAMPVKNGLYDFMQLTHQVAETAKSHKREESDKDGEDTYKPSQDEYLSGFYKTDKLLPVMTLVVFYSAEKWDGPLTLREMYSVTDEALTKDKEKLQEVVQKDKNFRNLERQAAEVIRVTTNSKLKYQEGQEAVDVCAAIEEMKLDSRLEGKKEGKKEGEIKGSIETYKEVHFSLQETIQRVAEKFDLSLQRSEEEVRKYWE